MAYDGTLKFDTALDAAGMQKDANKLGDIVKGLYAFDILKKGVQMVADSVQAAMSRLDTMDQFNRVMTTMTGSTDKANAALERTNEIVAGTAFGLDTASKGVQAFVASGMEVTKATDTMGAWADAVSFYTKGTNAELETVSMALQKMGTKGNVTMEHLQMLLEAGIPAIQIYASAVGKSTEEVTAQMSKGELKTDDFISAMNAAFETGTAGFPSIAGAAKDAGASWSGSIDNMKAAITRGVASMLTSFDKMFGIKSGMVSFGKTIENVLKGIAENMDIIAPVTMTAVGALIAYKGAIAISGAIKTFRTAQKGIAAAFATTMGAITKETAATLTNTGAKIAMTGIISTNTAAELAATGVKAGLTAAQHLQTAAIIATTNGIHLATAAQYLWNVAMEANPIGLIIALVAALTAGIYALTKALESDAYKEQKEKIDALKDAHDELENSMEESAAAYEDQKRELYATGVSAQQALDKLSQFGDGTLSAAADQAVMESALEKLNGTYENLNVTQEEFEKDPEGTIKRIQAYKDLTQSIAEYDAYLSRVATAEDEYAQAQAGLLDIEIQRKEIAQQVKNGTLNWYEAGKLLEDLLWTEQDYNKTLEETKGTLDALGDIANDSVYKQEVALKNRTEALNGAVDSEGRNLKKIAQEWGLTEDEILNAMDATGKSLGEWVDDNKKYYSSDGKNIEQIAKQWGKTTGDVKTWIDEMGSDLDGFVEYSKSQFTESGMDVSMLAKKWGMTVAQVKGYCNEWGMSYNDFNEEMKATHTDAGLSIEQLAVKWGTTTEAIKEQMAMQEIDLQTWSDNQDQTLEEWNAAVKENTDLVINDFEKLPTKMDYSLNDMIRIMNENADKYDAWRGKMAQVSSMLTPEVLSYLEQLGPGTSQILDGIINDTTGAKAEELNAAFARVGASAVEGAKSKVPEVTAAGAEYSTQFGTGMAESSAPSEASQQIADTVVNNLTNADYSGITRGIAEAIRSGAGNVTAAASGIGTAVDTQFKSMSQKSENTVTKMMSSITSKITSRTGSVRSAMTSVVMAAVNVLNTLPVKVGNLIDQAMTKIQTRISASKGGVTSAMSAVSGGIVSSMDSLPGSAAEIINQMFAGMRNAVDAQAPSLYRKIDSVCSEIKRRMKEAMEVHSPSKFTEYILKMFLKGGEVGVDRNKKGLFRGIDKVTLGVMRRMEELPDALSDLLSGQMQMRIDGNQTVVGQVIPAAAIAGAGAGSPTVVYNSNFNQTVNSPKALSASELTREAVDAQRRQRWQLK